MSNWKVTAVLAGPLAGDAPYLDALLEYQMAQRHGVARVINRSDECPPIGSVHIPCLRGGFGGVNGIPRCSAPIYRRAEDRHDHFAKRIAVEFSDCVAPESRVVVPVGNSWTKSYRLPLRVASVDRVVWFVGGSKRKSLKSLLDGVRAIGKKCSQGYGRIAGWEFEEVEHDWSWFADTEHGRLLMRILPWCSDLESVIGCRRWFGGVAAPYWHPGRMMEVGLPC